jgi:hypothetical protein
MVSFRFLSTKLRIAGRTAALTFGFYRDKVNKGLIPLKNEALGKLLMFRFIHYPGPAGSGGEAGLAASIWYFPDGFCKSNRSVSQSQPGFGKCSR